MVQTKFTRFKRINTFILAILLIIVSFILMGSYSVTTNIENKDKEPIEVEDTITINNEYIKQVKDSIYYALLGEIDNYIKIQSPKANENIPKYLLDAGIEHDIDICFMMAQTQIETNFGTTGAGKETSRKSLFGVYLKKYDTYENAVNDYCMILHKYYIGKGKTEKHLLQNYTTHSGKRYAENTNYEQALTKAYNNIKRKTNISELQDKLKVVET